MPAIHPITLLSTFTDRDRFFENYMYHVPSGGLFIDLFAGTSTPLLTQDWRELVGQIAEVRLKIREPQIEMDFRGVITYASPYELGHDHRRIGVEFFTYENHQKNFLLDILNDDIEALACHRVSLRQYRRFPARFRVQFTAQEKERVCVVGRMEEISRGGCSFNTVRFLQPGTKTKINIRIDREKGHLNLQMSSIVRWSDPTNFNRRLMGLEFDFTDPETQKYESEIHHLIDTIQLRCENELIHRRTTQNSTAD